MPDPLLYLQAISTSLVSSAILVLIIQWTMPRNLSGQRVAGVLATGLGVASGLLVLRFQFVWPPANALDRFLLIVLPAALVVEVVGSVQRIPQRLVRGARIGFVAVTVPVLLYGSVYLLPSEGEWIAWNAGGAILLSAGLLATAWMSMRALAARSSDLSNPLAVSMATVAAGLLVMMAGYLKGGSAAFPLAAALFGTAVSSHWIARLLARKRVAEAAIAGSDAPESTSVSSAAVGIGMIGLFGILFVGRFFGGITAGTAVIVLLTPLLCWVGELPGLRRSQPWKVFVLRLALVTIPLGVVLAAAKRDFDRDMAPLMMRPLSHPQQ